MLSYRVLISILCLLLLLVIGCAPVKFSPTPQDPVPANKERKETKEEVERTEPQELSHFMKYLNGEISSEHMISWIFSDAENFRSTIYGIEIEISKMNHMNESQQLKTVFLEYELNKIILKFNGQNTLIRSYEVTRGMLERWMADEEYIHSQSPSFLRENGITPLSISDSNLGVLNSIFENGFTIEEVHFSKRIK